MTEGNRYTSVKNGLIVIDIIYQKKGKRVKRDNVQETSLQLSGNHR